jgi:hypothetical protein
MTDSSRKCANMYSTEVKRKEKQIPFFRIFVLLGSYIKSEIDYKIHNICSVKKIILSHILRFKCRYCTKRVKAQFNVIL